MKFNKNKFNISYVKVKVRKITTMSTAVTTTVGLVTILPLAACALLTFCFYYFKSNPSKTYYLLDPAYLEFLKFLNDQKDSFAELDPLVMRITLGMNLINSYLRLTTIALSFLSNSKICVIGTYPETVVLYNYLVRDYEKLYILLQKYIEYSNNMPT